MDKIIVRHFKELNFTVVATPDEYHVDYTIYEHEGIETNGNVLFHRKGSLHSPDPVENIDDSEAYISGSVKWDGCSNWNFDEQDRGVMLHGCTKEDVVNLGLILGECWDWTESLCDHWNP